MSWPIGVPSVSLAAVQPSPSPREIPGRMTGEGHPKLHAGRCQIERWAVPRPAASLLWKADCHEATQRHVSSDDLPAAAALMGPPSRWRPLAGAADGQEIPNV